MVFFITQTAKNKSKVQATALLCKTESITE